MRCLDANIWIYYFDRTLPEHETIADAVVPILEDEPLFMTTVLQMEVIHYLHTQLENSAEIADRFLALEDCIVAELTTEDVANAAEILRANPQAGIGGRDATVLAAMERNGITRLWTHDHGLYRMGDRLEWLETADPLE